MDGPWVRSKTTQKSYDNEGPFQPNDIKQTIELLTQVYYDDNNNHNWLHTINELIKCQKNIT